MMRFIGLICLLISLAFSATDITYDGKTWIPIEDLGSSGASFSICSSSPPTVPSDIYLVDGIYLTAKIYFNFTYSIDDAFTNCSAEETRYDYHYSYSYNKYVELSYSCNYAGQVAADFCESLYGVGTSFVDNFTCTDIMNFSYDCIELEADPGSDPIPDNYLAPIPSTWSAITPDVDTGAYDYSEPLADIAETNRLLVNGTSLTNQKLDEVKNAINGISIGGSDMTVTNTYLGDVATNTDVTNQLMSTAYYNGGLYTYAPGQPTGLADLTYMSYMNDYYNSQATQGLLSGIQADIEGQNVGIESRLDSIITNGLKVTYSANCDNCGGLEQLPCAYDCQLTACNSGLLLISGVCSNPQCDTQDFTNCATLCGGEDKIASYECTDGRLLQPCTCMDTQPNIDLNTTNDLLAGILDKLDNNASSTPIDFNGTVTVDMAETNDHLSTLISETNTSNTLLSQILSKLDVNGTAVIPSDTDIKSELQAQQSVITDSFDTLKRDNPLGLDEEAVDSPFDPVTVTTSYGTTTIISAEMVANIPIEFIRALIQFIAALSALILVFTGV